MDRITFTYAVKQEIAQKEFNKEDLRYLLAGFSKINGRLNLSDKGDSLYFKTENAKIAKFIFVCLQKRYEVSPRFSYVKNMHFDKSVTFYIIVDSKVQEIIDDLGLFDFSDEGLNFIKDDEAIRDFFSGAFLASGSVNNPRSSNYHLEISFADEYDALFAQKLLKKAHLTKFHAHVVKRRSQNVLYIKKSNQIADFLTFIHAEEACLEFENVRVDREFLNNDNRRDICQIANIARTVESSKKQKRDIEIIDKKMGIDNISNEKMRLVCKIRLNSEDDMTMQEIALEVSKKLDTSVSKSNINHILRSIHELANRLGKGEKND